MEDAVLDVKCLCDGLDPGISWWLGVLHDMFWNTVETA
jgi:hypothetical protein